MELFSSNPENKPGGSRPIPKAVFEAVSVMGAAPQSGMQRNDSSVTQKNGAQIKKESPFLSPNSFPSAPPRSVAPIVTQKPQGTSLSHQMEPQKKKKILMLIVGGVFLILITGLALWYFFRRGAGVADVPQESPSEVTMVAAPLSTTLPEAPFAPDATNFLMIDTETVTQESLMALLGETGVKISAAQMNKPVEFLLTDKNNNPIAFSRFAYLMDLSLPEDLIAALGETFSVFLYNTNGKITLGLSFAPFAPADMGTVRELVTKSEPSLPFLFRTLLFRDLTVPQKSLFRSGVYNNETVRYVNIDTDQNISFDYVMREKEWLIGTSKDTLRSIIDKKSQP